MSATDTSLGLHRWWGEAWLATLDTSSAAVARVVQQGEALLRRGGVQEVVIAAGGVRAGVVGARGQHARVELGVPVFDEATWDEVTAVVAERLRFTAGLLQGELPAQLGDRLREAGAELLPEPDELTTACDVDPRKLCPHLVAVHRAVAVRIDRDPTLLFVLRGRAGHEVLHDVRAARGEEAGDDVRAELPEDGDVAAARGDLDAVVVHPRPSADPAWLLRHLGAPPGVEDPEPLAALVEQASGAAWRLAAGEGAADADVELLLAELRSRRTAGAEVLAEALGRATEEVEDELETLYERGTVLKTGSGRRARFRVVDA